MDYHDNLFYIDGSQMEKTKQNINNMLTGKYCYRLSWNLASTYMPFIRMAGVSKLCWYVLWITFNLIVELHLDDWQSSFWYRSYNKENNVKFHVESFHEFVILTLSIKTRKGEENKYIMWRFLEIYNYLRSTGPACLQYTKKWLSEHPGWITKETVWRGWLITRGAEVSE